VHQTRIGRFYSQRADGCCFSRLYKGNLPMLSAPLEDSTAFPNGYSAFPSYVV